MTARGRLTLQSFPGPPNYDSIKGGDAEERVFILELPELECIDTSEDTSEFILTVHVSSTDEALRAILRKAVGRRIKVRGEGFASYTGHHHARLVLLADRVSIR